MNVTRAQPTLSTTQKLILREINDVFLSDLYYDSNTQLTQDDFIVPLTNFGDKVYCWTPDIEPNVLTSGISAIWKNVTTCAHDTVHRITPIVDTLLDSRKSKLQIRRLNSGSFIVDEYVSPDYDIKLKVDLHGSFSEIYHSFHIAYHMVLTTGSDTDVINLDIAFQNLVPFILWDLSSRKTRADLDSFINGTRTAAIRFGKWHQHVRDLLTELTVLSNAKPPSKSLHY